MKPETFFCFLPSKRKTKRLLARLTGKLSLKVNCKKTTIPNHSKVFLHEYAFKVDEKNYIKDKYET